MRRIIVCFAFFAAGIGVGAFLMQPGRAESNSGPALRLNHVGIYVKDFDESMRFYTQTMGFHEAFTIKDPNGKPVLAYLQITRDTFLELAPNRRPSSGLEPHRHLAGKSTGGRCHTARARRHGRRPSCRFHQNQHHQRHGSERRPAGTGRFSCRFAPEESHGRLEAIIVPWM